MKACSECGSKSLNSASECENCGGALVESKPVSQEDPDTDSQRKVLRALDRLAEAEASPRKVDISLASMSISDMAVLHFKLFVSALPLAATLLLVGFGLAWLIR